MSYYDLIYNIAVFLMFSMAIYFFIILCFGSGYRIHSFIILTSCLIGLAIPEAVDESKAEFLRCVNTSILLDGVTAFSLTMFLIFDKLAWKQALLLAFATICHIMINYDLTIASSIFSLFFYSFYDELIITIGVLQMTVSYNGINIALRNVREHLLRFSFNIWCFSKSISSHKRSGERS